jgi:hypothetical protein
MKRNLLYVGPINALVSRLKSFSLASSVASTALAPILIYYTPDHLSVSLKIGLASTSKRNWLHNVLTQSNLLLSVVLLTSYGTTALFHGLVGKYVYHLWKAASEGDQQLIFEKRSLFNRKRFLAVPQSELIAGGSIFSTWKWLKGREAFMIQYADSEGESGSNVASFGGERVDREAMAKIFKEVMQRR